MRSDLLTEAFQHELDPFLLDGRLLSFEKGVLTFWLRRDFDPKTKQLQAVVTQVTREGVTHLPAVSPGLEHNAILRKLNTDEIMAISLASDLIHRYWIDQNTLPKWVVLLECGHRLRWDIEWQNGGAATKLAHNIKINCGQCQWASFGHPTNEQQTVLYRLEDFNDEPLYQPEKEVQHG